MFSYTTSVALKVPVSSTVILNFFVLPLVLEGTIKPPSEVTSSALLLVITPLDANTPLPTAKAVSLLISLQTPTALEPLEAFVKSCPCPAAKQNCLLTKCVCPKPALLFAKT